MNNITTDEAGEMFYDVATGTVTFNGTKLSTTSTINSGTGVSSGKTTITTGNITGNLTGGSNNIGTLTGGNGAAGGIYGNYGNNGVTWNTTITQPWTGPATTWQPQQQGPFSFPLNAVGMPPEPTSTKLVTDPIYPTGLVVGNAIHRAHYDVWKELQPDVEHHFVTIYSTLHEQVSTRQLVFTDLESFNLFNEFWIPYAARFGDVFAELYPSPKPHGVVHLLKPDQTKAAMQWRWIIQNCNEPVTNAAGYWAFESAADKSKFMLAHSE